MREARIDRVRGESRTSGVMAIDPAGVLIKVAPSQIGDVE